VASTPSGSDPRQAPRARGRRGPGDHREGALDEQTLRGEAPAGIAAAARAAGVLIADGHLPPDRPLTEEGEDHP
jgi:hypothetical protein